MGLIQGSSSLQGLKTKGQAWYVATKLQSDLIVEVDDVVFHLHKFPLLSKSGQLNKLVFEARDTENDHIKLLDLPGGAESFELAAKFCYGSIPVEISPSNVAALRCAAEYLEMTEDLEQANLVSKTEDYLTRVILASWVDCITVLRSCSVLSPWAENLNIVQRCIESLAWKATTDPCGITWSFTSKDKDIDSDHSNLSKDAAQSSNDQTSNGDLDESHEKSEENVYVELQKLRGEFVNLEGHCQDIQLQLEKISKHKKASPLVNFIRRWAKQKSPTIQYGKSVKEACNTQISTPQQCEGSASKPRKWRRNSI